MLLAFNDAKDDRSLSATELQEITGLDDSELKKALISLSIAQ